MKKTTVFCFVQLFLTISIVFGQIPCTECKRADGKINQVGDVVSLDLEKAEVFLPCFPGSRSRSGSCKDDMTVEVITKAVDKENDKLVYRYTVSGGRIIGSGEKVTWDLSSVRPGTYTITAAVDDGCGFCGKTITKTVTVENCPDCESPCATPLVDLSGGDSIKSGDLMTITANVIGGGEYKYNWTVSNGYIVSGSGTSSIVIDTTGVGNQNVTATVEIVGGCEPVTKSFSFNVQLTQPSYRPIIQSICSDFTPPNSDELEAVLKWGRDSERKGFLFTLLLANSFYEKEEYDSALNHLNQILQQNKVDRDNLNPCVLNLLGSIYNNTGNYQKAVAYYQQIFPLAEKAHQSAWKTTAESNIGLAYFRLKKYPQAILSFKKSIKNFTALKDDYGLASTYNFYGAALREMKLYQQAVVIHTKALDLAGNNNYQTLAADIFEELGRDALAQKQIQKAIPIFEQSLALFRRIPDTFGETETLLDLMDVWNKNNQPGLAIFYGSQAINLLQKVRRNTQTFSLTERNKLLVSKEKYYRQLADLFIAQGNFVQAEKVLAMLKEDEYIGFVRRDADEIKKLAALETVNPADRAILQKYEELAGEITKIGTQVSKLEQQIKTQTVEYAELKAKLDTANAAFRIFLEKTLTPELGKPVANEIRFDRALQAELQQWGEGTVMLYTIAGADRYRVILTTPKTQIDRKFDIPIAELNKKIFAFRSALQNPATEPRGLGKELYDILIKPLENDLKEAKTLVWSLDGTLRYIPVAALSPDGKSYLAEKYKNVVVTSIIRQKLVSGINPDWKMLGGGVTRQSKVVEPDGTAEISFSSLPGVQNELLSIIGDEESRLVDDKFKLSVLEEKMSQRLEDKPKYNVIHLATHFRLGSDSARSFLLLGNNQALTLEKVSDSTALNFGDVEMVTLSACNTGFGTAIENKAPNKEEMNKILAKNNGVEVDSLATFISQRGAKSVMATLWAVADESTSLLMREFYRIKKENPKLTKAEALQMAQKAMIEGKIKPSGNNSGCRSDIIPDASEQPKFECKVNAPYSHPYYWSPFILIGNWR